MSASLLSSRLINFLRKIDIRVEVLRNKRAEQKVRVSLELCVWLCIAAAGIAACAPRRLVAEHYLGEAATENSLISSRPHLNAFKLSRSAGGRAAHINIRS